MFYITELPNPGMEKNPKKILQDFRQPKMISGLFPNNFVFLTTKIVENPTIGVILEMAHGIKKLAQI